MMNAKPVAAPAAASIAANDNRQAPRIVRATPPVAGRTLNPGYCPREADGKRVHVTLANGHGGTSWAADGRNGCRWSIMGTPFDIEFYEVVA